MCRLFISMHCQIFFLLSFKKRLHISFSVCTQQMPGLLDFREVCWKVTKFIQVETNFLTRDLFLKFCGKSIYVLLIKYSTPLPIQHSVINIIGNICNQ